MSENDSEFIQRMLKLFIKISIESVLNIGTALKEGNLITIRKEIHKLKPSFNNMSISILDNDIQILEQYNSEKITGEIKKVILNICDNLVLIVEQLKSETTKTS
jgi:hypothetical protein